MSDVTSAAVTKSHSWQADAQFWGAFLALNMLLFTPLTVLMWGSYRPTSAASWIEFLLVTRPSNDLFRLNVEWVFFIALWAALYPIRNGLTRVLLGLLYACLFAYYLYEAIKVAFFSALPIAYDDFYLLRDSGAGLLQHFDFPLWMLVTIVIALTFIGYLLRFVAAERFVGKLSLPSQMALIVLCIPGLVSTALLPNISASPDGVFSSAGLKIVGNANRSRASREQQQAAEQILAELALNDAETVPEPSPSAEIETANTTTPDFRFNPYDYSHTTLLEKPTVYMIFIESYGDVLYTHPELQAPFKTLIEELDSALAQSDWHVASSFSWTPVYGGGSWLAYTSLLTGLTVNNEPLYNTLVQQSVNRPVFSLSRYLQSQGYLYNRVTPLPVDSAEEKAFLNKLNHFYGYDRWLTIDDLDYTGSLYGWGPAPPDQFTLGRTRDYANSLPQPSLNFFITHNSHAPWGTQPSLAEEWQALQEESALGKEVVGDSDFAPASYLAAIDYQLRTALDFVQSETRDDVIFILVGDHQPPRISSLNGSPFTPMHIIGRDLDFIDDFYFFEFANTLQVPQLDIGIYHEGFLSLFMRAFLGNYSDTGYDELPPYLPNGLRFGALSGG